MNAPDRKNVCSKSTIETPKQTMKFANTVKFIRMALEYIKLLHLLLRAQFGTLNMYFQTGQQFDVIQIYLQIKYLYISYFFSFIEIVQLELYVGSFKYPANIYLFELNNRHIRTKCIMYPALVIKTPERCNSRRSSAFIVNFEHM